MSESFEVLEQQYKDATNRVSKAYTDLREVVGDPKPLGAGEPPVITKEERDAYNAVHQALAVYVPLRDRYWATRWGREGNPPKQ
ncbi:hypothetical protein [Streptomyces sp. NPDC101132]|uniref:hypothetical protein n=1 Tax=Streptomyces sp. NPDC101132 TaxID=3366110 RepID=UPI0037F6E641